MIVLAIAAAAIILQLAVLLFTFYKKQVDLKFFSGQERTGVKLAHLFMTAGMVFIGLQMWRNMAVSSLIVVPSSLVCITGGLQYFLGEKIERPVQKNYALTNAVVFLLLSIYGGYLIVSGKLYNADICSMNLVLASAERGFPLVLWTG